jgi:iron complex outermembrane receptor protein
MRRYLLSVLIASRRAVPAEQTLDVASTKVGARANRLLLLIPFLCMMPMMLFAQAPFATRQVAGVLSDQSGAAVQGGRIEIKSLDSGFMKATVTDQEGRYVFDSVPVGRYQVTAALTGFETAVRSGVLVSANQETVVDFSLTVSKQAVVVNVTAPAITLDSEALVSEKARTSDTASLLDGIPGLSLYGGGGVSNLPAIHGLADDRVDVQVNGMTFGTSCSNHMNPPLSYVDPANVGGINVWAGITPVSIGGDNIGGTIIVDSPAPVFAAPGRGIVTHGGITGFHRTNGVVSGGDAWVSAASKNFRVGYTGSYVFANNYKDGAGAMVLSTLYQSTNHTVHLAGSRGNNLLTADLGYQHIPYQGFVNAHMDMVGNKAEFGNIRYRHVFNWGNLDARVFYEHTTHEMNILNDKRPIKNMNMPMDTRGADFGYSFKVEIPLFGRDILRAGTELHRFTLDDWWPAVSTMVGSMGPNTLLNINNGRRDVFGTYLEWEGKLGRGFTELLGIRSNVVLMNTGNVQGYNSSTTTTGSAAYIADATAFNSVNHSRLDNNVDLTALGRYEPYSNTTLEFGYARKTRSPNLYERYLWVKQSAMSVDMNGWFGDLNGYTGNLDLRPEVAHTVSFTAGLHDAAKRRRELKITPYYTHVQDYIDVSRCPVSENGLGNGCTAAAFNATSATLATVPYVTLKFGNYAAQLFGVDVSGRLPLGGNDKMGYFSLNGLIGYVRGKDTAPAAPGSPGQQPLYHMMPLNAKVALEHHRGNWSNGIGLHAVEAKNDVQAVRIELPTPGYALVDLRTSYQWPVHENAGFRLDVGIDNVAGRDYILPLGGRYYGPTMAAIREGASVPGMGRTFYAGLTFKF